MPGYRINERNTGYWSLDGEPKRRRKKKTPPPPVATDEQLAQILVVNAIENLLSGFESDYHAYLTFDCTSELQRHWLKNEYAFLATRPSSYAAYGFPPKTILAVNPEKIDDLIFVKNLMIEMFELQPFV